MEESSYPLYLQNILLKHDKYIRVTCTRNQWSYERYKMHVDMNRGLELGKGIITIAISHPKY